MWRIGGHSRYSHDAGIALAVGTASFVAMTGRAAAGQGEVRPLAWLSLVALLVPLVWRRRAPVLVFWTTFGLAWLTGLVDENLPAIYLVPLFALYAVARYRPVRFLLLPVAAIELGVTGSWLLEEAPWNAVVVVTAVTAATALLGVNTRTRRAYLDGLEERAQRLTRERDQQAQLAAAAERARIAREMHDIVAHNLAVMIALADGAAYTATAAPERSAAIMRRVSDTGRQALTETRRLLGVLREDSSGPALSPQPGLDDIDRLIGQIRAAGLQIAVTRAGMPTSYDAGTGLAVYRIVQEALTNALKHAGLGATAGIRLEWTDREVELEIVNDGAPGAAPTVLGHGLAGMTERAAAAGGRLEAGPAPGGRWRVHARLPIPAGVDR